MSLSKEKIGYVAAGAAALAISAAVYFYAYSGSSSKPEESAAVTVDEEVKQSEKQEEAKTAETKEVKATLYKSEALERSKCFSDLHYRISFALLPGGKTFRGQVEVDFKLLREIKGTEEESNWCFLDYTGQVFKVLNNGKEVEIKRGEPKSYKKDRIYLQADNLNVGQMNKVIVTFESSYVRDCEGVQYFKDPEDQNEYLYSQFEAVNAHKTFPCFDQPDMKSKYDMLAMVKKGWQVLSTEIVDKKANKGDALFKSELARFGLNEEEWINFFEKDQDLSVFTFGDSPLISCYLYSIIAGPYETIVSADPKVQNYRFPLKLYCRQSIKKWVEMAKEQYFTTTRCGIDHYEKLFSTKYPFSKLDQVFVPDYSNGAMENVGCVIYRDQYVQRDEVFSDSRKQAILNVFLHEISHMWFGNLVTMSWWDDLWLNESFANYVSYICLDEAEGLEEYKLSWSNFLRESFWGLVTDQMPTTHPICVDVKHTEMADDIFDGISYGKGASWLNQTFYQFGRGVFSEGIKTYFAEYSFKNTKLEDFIRHMNMAAKKVLNKEDFGDWAETWLKTSGCNTLWHTWEEKDGKITKFTAHQGIFSQGDSNRLRQQKYRLDLLDKNMKVTKSIDILTSDSKETVDVKELVGTEVPYCFHINAGNYGFGKFKIDEHSLHALEKSLYKIEKSMDRKQIYNILNDMLRTGDISGAQLLDIILKQIRQEKADDVLSDVFNSIVPVIIKRYLPADAFLDSHAQIANVVFQMLAFGGIKVKSTRHMLLTALINSSKNAKYENYLVSIFNGEDVMDDKGTKILDKDAIEVSSQHKHDMMKTFWSSRSLTLDTKKTLMKKLEDSDKSDWISNTKAFCNAALPETKAEMWEKFFAAESECNNWGLHTYQHSFMGFNQGAHADLVAPFASKFFENIEPIFLKKGRFVASAYFTCLRPMSTSDDNIKRYEELLKVVRTNNPDNSFLIDLITDTIYSLGVMATGQKLSAEYLAKQKK